jgi:hypothetical protein
MSTESRFLINKHVLFIPLPRPQQKQQLKYPIVLLALSKHRAPFQQTESVAPFLVIGEQPRRFILFPFLLGRTVFAKQARKFTRLYANVTLSALKFF